MYSTYDPVIYDDFVPESYQKVLEEYVKTLQYRYHRDSNGNNFDFTVYYKNEIYLTNHQAGLVHLILHSNETLDAEAYRIFSPIFSRIEEEVGEIELVRIRIGLNYSDGYGGIHPPHIDHNTPHDVLVYYINDSDGGTVLYEERSDFSDKEIDFHIDRIVTPRRGRAVMFDGLQFHSAASPKDFDLRYIINIAFKRKNDERLAEN